MTFQEAHPELFNGSVDTTQDVKPFSNETGNSNVSPVANYQGTMTRPVASSTTTPVINNTNTNNYNNNTQQVSYDPKPFENETINKNETFANKGLSEKQQGELQDLVKYKPVDTWTQTDWNNYNYAINLQDKSAQIENAINNDRANTPNDLSMIVSDLVSKELSQSGAKEVGDYAIESSKLPTNIAPTPEVDISGYKAYLTDTEYLALQQDQQRAKYWNEKQTAMENYINTTMNNMGSIADRIGSYANMIEAQQRELDTSSMIRLTNQANQEIEKATNNLTALLNTPSSSLSDITSKRIAKQEYNATIATYSAGVQKAQGNLNGALETINKYYSNIIDPLQRQFDDYDTLLYKSINLYGTYNQNYKEELKREQDKISSAIQYAKEQRDIANACISDASWNNAVNYYGASLDDDPYTMLQKLNSAKADDELKQRIRNAFPDVNAGMGDSLEDWLNALSKSPTYISNLTDGNNLANILKDINNGIDPITAIYNNSTAGNVSVSMSTSSSRLYNGAMTAAGSSSNVDKTAETRKQEVNKFASNGDYFEVQRITYDNIVNGLTADEKKKVEYRAQLINIFNDKEFQDLLNSKDKSDEADLRKGNDNSVFNKVQSKINKILSRFGVKGTDREKVMAVIQPLYVAYRKNATGVAFSAKEEASYKEFFISDADSAELFKAKVYGLMFNEDAEVRAIFETHLGGDSDLARQIVNWKSNEEIFETYKYFADNIDLTNLNSEEDVNKRKNIIDIINNSDSPRKAQVEDTVRKVIALDNLFHDKEFGSISNADNINQFSCGAGSVETNWVGQCGEFINDLMTIATGKMGGFGNSKTQKEAYVREMGGITNADEIYNHTYKRGDIVVMGSGENGHVAMVYNVSPSGIILLEGNAQGNGKITITRTGTAGEFGVSAVLPVDSYDKDNNLRSIFRNKIGE